MNNDMTSEKLSAQLTHELLELKKLGVKVSPKKLKLAAMPEWINNWNMGTSRRDMVDMILLNCGPYIPE